MVYLNLHIVISAGHPYSILIKCMLHLSFLISKFDRYIQLFRIIRHYRAVSLGRTDQIKLFTQKNNNALNNVMRLF